MNHAPHRNPAELRARTRGAAPRGSEERRQAPEPRGAAPRVARLGCDVGCDVEHDS